MKYSCVCVCDSDYSSAIPGLFTHILNSFLVCFFLSKIGFSVVT